MEFNYLDCFLFYHVLCISFLQYDFCFSVTGKLEFSDLVTDKKDVQVTKKSN